MSLEGGPFWSIKKKQELNKVKNTRLEVYSAWLERSHTETQKERAGALLKGQGGRRWRATVLLLPLVDN